MPAAASRRRAAPPARSRSLSSSNDFAADLATHQAGAVGAGARLREEADGLRQVVRRLEARKAELERALALGAVATSCRPSSRASPARSRACRRRSRSSTTRRPRCRRASTAPRPTSRSTTSSRACWSRINGGLVKVTQLGNAQGHRAPCCCRSHRPPRPAPATGRSSPTRRRKSNRRVSDREVAWLEQLKDKGLVEQRVQLGVLHLRRQPRARARRHPRRAGRLGADAAGDADASACRSAWRPRSISRSSRRRTA